MPLYNELLNIITLPIILFWFSDREPDYKDDYSSVKGIFHGFPQMVNREMTETIADLRDDYVECVTDRGLPNRLTSRFTGKRSEEHTSELQSRGHLVCRLLLEKKK